MAETRIQAKRVLVVDDEPKFCYIVAGFLMGRGYQTAVASRSDQIVTTLQRFNPDVVLLDIRMPEVSGLDILRLIRSHPAPVRVIMVTVMDTTDAIDEAMDNGADGYLCKPVDLNQLEELISTL